MDYKKRHESRVAGYVLGEGLGELEEGVGIDMIKHIVHMHEIIEN